MLRIYNTLSEKKEVLEKPKDRPLRMFVCGPTVYDNPHIGNARTFMAFDIIVRYLRSRGLKIFYLQNITDIDDKILNRAKEEDIGWKDVAKQYEKAFSQNLKALGIKSVNKYARATDFIPEIIKQVKTLIKKGNAYLIPGDGYYFDLKTFPDYGRLAKRTVAQAEDGVSRIDASDKKRNRGDFCIWKLSALGEHFWKTELGDGRPGWHIEDTAITEKFFGPQYDIHGGALDLKFPHHEAEIAQQESASGKKPFVKIWMHAGFLTVSGQKMSKSLGNFVTIGESLAKYPAEVFRMAVFMHHYRLPLDYTDEAMLAAQKNLAEIKTFILKLAAVARKTGKKEIAETIAKELDEAQNKFLAALNDDFNGPQALAAIFEFMKVVNAKIWRIPGREAKSAGQWLKNTMQSLGFDVKLVKIPAKIQVLVKKRAECRRYKQFTQSDTLRQKIFDLGYVVEDNPLGQFVYPRT